MRLIRGGIPLALLLTLSLEGCEQNSEDTPSIAEAAEHSSVDDAASTEDGLTFTSRGSYEIHEATAVCQPSVEHEDTMVVRMNAPPDYWKQRKPRVAFLYVEVVPGAEGVYELPLDGGGDDHLQDVTVFSYDPETKNELSGSVETSTGTITIREASCDPEPRLDFTIRATLGSEYADMSPVHVVGGLSAHS